MTAKEIDPTGINEILDQAAKDISAAKPFKAQRTAYASSGFECLLKQYYQRVGMTPTNQVYEPDYEVSAEIGNALHALYQARLVASGRVVMLPAWDDSLSAFDGLQPAIEVPLNEKTLTSASWQRMKAIGFAGRPDAYIKVKQEREDGSPKIAYFEIKTCSVKDAVPENQYFADKLSHWEWQVQSCLEVAEFPSFGKSDFGLIYMVSHDKDLRTKQRIRRLFRVTPNPGFIVPELTRLEHLTGLVVRQGPAPEPEPHRGPCRLGPKVGCQFYDLCPASEGEKRQGK